MILFGTRKMAEHTTQQHDNRAQNSVGRGRGGKNQNTQQRPPQQQQPRIRPNTHMMVSQCLDMPPDNVMELLIQLLTSIQVDGRHAFQVAPASFKVALDTLRDETLKYHVKYKEERASRPPRQFNPRYQQRGQQQTELPSPDTGTTTTTTTTAATQ